MAGQAPPNLTPESLFDQQARIDAARLEVYNRFLRMVHQKIKTASTLPGAPQMTVYDVPDWHPGCPRYDVKDCILYLVWNLRHSGFQVLYVSPNRLLISWKEQSIQYYQEESPIRQAMIMAAEQNRPFSAAPPPVMNKPEKKKAAAYRPANQNVAELLAQGSGSNSGRKGGSNGSNTITFI